MTITFSFPCVDLLKKIEAALYSEFHTRDLNNWNIENRIILAGNPRPSLCFKEYPLNCIYI